MACKENSRKLCGKLECETCFNKSFASHIRQVEWSKKNERSPFEISKNCNNKFYFNCKICKHEIEQSLGKINGGNRKCPYCQNRKLCTNNECNFCFQKSFVINEHADEWSEKNDKTAREVFKNCPKKFLFECKKCDHEFMQSPNAITCKGNWCAYCSNQKLCNNDDCIFCLANSFACSDKAKYWSQKNGISPRRVFIGSDKKYIFDCYCGHEFSMQLDVIKRGGWCPYCNNKLLCGDNECIDCFLKSFASHKKSKYWSDKNVLKPRQVFLSSNEKYYFDCKCKHELYMRAGDISYKNRWCKYCAKQALCNDYDCEMCWNNSFASHEKAEFWSEKNYKCVREVFKGTLKQYIFNCDNKHEFSMRLSNITCHNQWCPYCTNKTEGKLYHWFVKNNYDIIYQETFEWCKKAKLLPFDFCIEEYKLLIELDGRQHFEKVLNWNDPEKIQENDVYKMKQANKNGYTVIRLLQKDVWYDKNNWEENLEKHLYYHKEPAVIYISNGNEYKDHKEKMLK